MDVGSWLRRLGLEQYEAAFRENEIDGEVLPSLTAEDLKELGVASVGHRRKLLDAIAALRAGVSAPPPLSEAPPATDKAGKDTAERRQVTVMFSDLVGSTSLSARMDPEDLREIISAYQTCVAGAVRRFEGFVAKYMGDGVLNYFGYPQAHEDDAERAVRAALEAIAAVGALKLSVPLQTRVGIATGMVVVGDLIGSGEAQERGIVGETPNLAARLQGVAEPNAVVIAESTRRLLGNLFELKDLGPQDLKGIPGNIRAWAALRSSSAEGRFEALHAGRRLTELIGRQEEQDVLLRRWSMAKTGQGQVVLLSGEPGIGKSRLTAAVMEELASEPHTRLRYFCTPQHTDSALFPIIGQMERAAGLTHDDTAKAKLDKLDNLLVRTLTSTQDTALFAEMLSLPNDGRYSALKFTPQQRRQKTLEALVSQLEALTRQNPVLMIFEDAHWIDPTSLEAIGRAVDRIVNFPLLLIVTFRPEFDPPWIGQPRVTALTINRLTQPDVNAMIDGVVGDKLIPASIRRDIVERTDGVPLFIEEMTKAVLEAEGEREARRIAAAVPSPTQAVPASLHASLMARLDRLGPAKEVAQIGAVVGRAFSHTLLAAVVRKSDAELGSALDRLIAAGLLFRQGMSPHVTYVFKHALVQNAAYGTLLREPRRKLHARIAAVLEMRFPEVAESQPELLARHCTEAGLTEKAAELWGKAGLRSLARSALAEATEQLASALAQIAALPGTTALRRHQIKLQVGLANALMHTKGYASSDTKASLDQARLLIERAEALGEAPEDPLLLFSVLYGFWVASYTAFNGDLVRELAAQFLTLAEKRGATEPLMIGHRVAGISLLVTGDFAQGRAHLDRSIALYEPSKHRLLATRFGQDNSVAILSYRSLALWGLGYPTAALTDITHLVRDAREIGQAATLMYALFYASLTVALCGDYSTASARADEVVALADKSGSLFWKTAGMINQGTVLALTGNASDAVDLIASALASYRSMGAQLFTPFYLSCLAQAHAQLGHANDARRRINEAMMAAQTTKERWYEADIHRIAGEIALMSPERDAAKAEAYSERSLAIARARQTKSFELRAATSMARLWRDQGKQNEARELLASVYGWFTEGFDTLDLKQAKALRDELTQ
ncbi:adenylate/guanylate cyclase domain-containing protein [Bradyrhizobium sp. Tv2a-2]|uniref:adenylate/guanylate cyclase domain-containing protein n=1 Tax=Bradyrhizobium sp. Tv2a-2 TaxID=113395 RepID=UPI00041CA7EB|nr:adenylate/guanylate cyclase domain-containing protein [Bradyrhizobium sp. Tv2a-2]